MKHLEMLSAQRESPLKPEQDDKQARQQWVSNVIDKGNFWHGLGDGFPNDRSDGHNITSGVGESDAKTHRTPKALRAKFIKMRLRPFAKP